MHPSREKYLCTMNANRREWVQFYELKGVASVRTPFILYKKNLPESMIMRFLILYPQNEKLLQKMFQNSQVVERTMIIPQLKYSAQSYSGDDET